MGLFCKYQAVISIKVVISMYTTFETFVSEFSKTYACSVPMEECFSKIWFSPPEKQNLCTSLVPVDGRKLYFQGVR